ncbi:hypothetical protein SAVCW2_03630 [Streptomyces avermitilis]|nr:hypothetical protein SAVCW2_03630 [Streptomyces avermitilis]
MSETTDLRGPATLEAWTCPAPLRDRPRVVMGHGGGGALSAELVQHVFAPAFGGEVLAQMGDAAALSLGGVRLAFSTDSFVVRPLFFPGGSIGDLAVNGTVNDLAMSGARAAYLSCGFILEEGVEVEVVARVAEALGRRRAPPASRWRPATPRWWRQDTATGSSSTRRASASSRRASICVRSGSSPATSSSSAVPSAYTVWRS